MKCRPYPIRPNVKAIGPIGIEKIRSLDEAFLVRLYYHTHDIVQKTLIEKLCELKGYELVVDMPGDTPTAA